MEFPTTLEELLVVGYVFFAMGLNLIAFLISAFYRKKVGKNAPYLGFLLSHLGGVVYRDVSRGGRRRVFGHSADDGASGVQYEFDVQRAGAFYVDEGGKVTV